jgi:cardiolipin synthase
MSTTIDRPAPAATDKPEIEVAGNQLRIFTESPEMIAALVADVRTARRRVWIETYTISDDTTVRELVAALKQKAAEGVECRLLYDSVGSVGTSNAFFKELEAAGILVHGYHSLSDAFWRNRFFRRFNRRNHRKLAVIDDHIGYFGGMNLVDQSGPPGLHSSKADPERTGKAWRDVHVRVDGPKSAEIASAMNDLWMRVLRKPRPRLKLWPVRQMLTDTADGIYFFDSRPTHKYRRPDKVIAHLLRRAHEKIVVAMAYFLPLRVILRQLFKARRRGVDVELILPGISDVPAVQWAARYMYRMLLKRGIRIYEREDRMLHSKAMVVDGRLSVVGSCNFDPRSLRINLEFFGVVRSEAFAQALEQVCVYERSHSQAIEMRHHEETPWYKRTLHRMAWWFRHWL